MPKADAQMMVGQLQYVLQEALEGPRDAKWSYFTDNRPKSGLLGSVRSLSADEASRVVGTASVAAHIHHTIFGMEVASAWISGNRTPHDWSESWSVTEVNDQQWTDMVERLEDEYRTLRQCIGAFTLTDEIAAGNSAGGLAHVAYHLGAVQQKMEILTAKG